MWKKLSGYVAENELSKLQSRYERVCRLPFLWWARILRTRGYRRYLHAEQSLYQAILIVSGKRVIVDSSKNPVRAFALASMSGVDFYVLHLVRDGRGVAWSLMKLIKDPEASVQNDLKAKPVCRTALSWLLVNILSDTLFARTLKIKMFFVRYEDFVEDVEVTLSKIGDFVGVDFRPVEKKINAGLALPVGHTIAGNRARMAVLIKLKPDYEWKKLFP